MKLPDTVVVDGLVWEVNPRAALSSDVFGVTEVDQCMIKLADRLDSQLKHQTFWHEVLHAIIHTREFEMQNLSNLPDDKIEEAVVRMIGPALFTFLRNNCDIAWKTHGFPE